MKKSETYLIKKYLNIANWNTQLQYYKIKLFSSQFNDTNDEIMDIQFEILHHNENHKIVINWFVMG